MGLGTRVRDDPDFGNTGYFQRIHREKEDQHSRMRWSMFSLISRPRIMCLQIKFDNAIYFALETQRLHSLQACRMLVGSPVRIRLSNVFGSSSMSMVCKIVFTSSRYRSITRARCAASVTRGNWNASTGRQRYLGMESKWKCPREQGATNVVLVSQPTTGTKTVLSTFSWIPSSLQCKNLTSQPGDSSRMTKNNRAHRLCV